MSQPDDLLARLAARSAHARTGVGTPRPSSAKVNTCPRCGAPRTRRAGLKTCAYCGHEFIAVTLTDGLFIEPERGTA
ncbi:MAG: hypothetical protein LBC97_08430 [Bifidobacteriaceae bacterium]|jgi:ribosomal protein L37AE/L43A|nr:hypothetical protein [Bifidobacteriaceae bacterium]